MKISRKKADKIAAICYLNIWQIGEFNPGPGENKPNPPTMSETPFRDILEVLGYPLDPVFNNESIPVINWRSRKYNILNHDDAVYEGISSIYGHGEDQ